MESLKRPEMIISASAWIGIIGCTTYLNSKIKSLNASLDKVSEHVAATVDKVAELQLPQSTLEEIGQSLNELYQVNQGHGQYMQHLKQLLDNQESQLQTLLHVQNNIVKALHDSGIEVDTRPPPKPVAKPAARPSLKMKAAAKVKGPAKKAQEKPPARHVSFKAGARRVEPEEEDEQEEEEENEEEEEQEEVDQEDAVDEQEEEQEEEEEEEEAPKPKGRRNNRTKQGRKNGGALEEDTSSMIEAIRKRRSRGRA